MASGFGSVIGMKAAENGKLSDGRMGCILENGMEIEDTFAEILGLLEISPA